jgi:hypothetical protein
MDVFETARRFGGSAHARVSRAPNPFGRESGKMRAPNGAEDDPNDRDAPKTLGASRRRV